MSVGPFHADFSQDSSIRFDELVDRWIDYFRHILACIFSPLRFSDLRDNTGPTLVRVRRNTHVIINLQHPLVRI